MRVAAVCLMVESPIRRIVLLPRSLQKVSGFQGLREGDCHSYWSFVSHAQAQPASMGAKPSWCPLKSLCSLRNKSFWRQSLSNIDWSGNPQHVSSLGDGIGTHLPCISGVKQEALFLAANVFNFSRRLRGICESCCDGWASCWVEATFERSVHELKLLSHEEYLLYT